MRTRDGLRRSRNGADVRRAVCSDNLSSLGSSGHLLYSSLSRQLLSLLSSTQSGESSHPQPPALCGFWSGGQLDRAGILVLIPISGFWPCELGPGTGAGDVVYGQAWQGGGKGRLPGRGSGVSGLLSGQTLHPHDHGEAGACTATYTRL